MRNVYYQSVGNPLQLDRLPATRPETEMLPPRVPLGSQLRRLAVSLSYIAAAVLVTFLLCWPPGLVWLEPYDLLFAGPVVAIGLGVGIATGQVRWLLQPLFLAGVAFLCLNPDIPWSLQVVLASIMVGVLVYSFGRHWSVVCTGTPLPRSNAEPLRLDWQRQLFVMAGIAALLTGAVLWSGALILKFAVLTLPLAAAAVRRPDGLRSSRWRVVFDSLVSWFTFDPRPLPGLLRSPVGPASHRVSLAALVAVLAAVMLVRWADSPLPRLHQWTLAEHQSVAQQLDTRGASSFEHSRYGGVIWGPAFIALILLPVTLPWAIAISLTIPVLLEAAAQREQANSANNVETMLADLRRSPDLTERNSLYLGRVVEDGSPVLVPRTVFQEHAHGLGDSGSGKTSLFLCPLIEQLVMSGNCSVIVLDLKADSLELLATLQASAEAVRRERGVSLRLKSFSNQADRATFAFNPMTQPFWKKFDLLTRTDILCGANGLTYGTDYGQGYYSSANAAVLYHALKTFPHVATFTELAECIGNVIMSADKRKLHPEIRKAGVHVHEVIKRLAACEPLNVTASTGHAPDVVEQAIDLTQVFQQPQLLYFHLSATLSPSGAPEMARLVNYMLLAAATQTERRHPVFLVIDEFQRMVASNLEYMMQLARSMGVGVILANQSMQDLKKSSTNLIPAIEANCRLRQWFSVSSSDDQQRVINGSGLTVDRVLGCSAKSSITGLGPVSYSETEQVVPRFTLNDVLLTSDHPFRSFLRISRGAGYAQYGGLPVIIESNYHISAEEYQRRKSLPWPTGPGTFVPRQAVGQDTGEGSQSTPSGPQWTEEVIGEDRAPLSPADTEAIDALFQQFGQSMPKLEPSPPNDPPAKPIEQPRRRRKRT